MRLKAWMELFHYHNWHLNECLLDVSPMWARCKNQVGNLIHTCWTCPQLCKYWEDVFKTLSEVFEIPLNQTPLTALFGVVAREAQLPKYKWNAIAFPSLIARRLILLKWKDESPPTHTHWIRDLLQFLRLEKIRSTLKGSTGRCYKAWQPLITHVEKCKLDLTI